MKRIRMQWVLAVFGAAVFQAAALSQSEGKPDLDKQPTLYVVGYAHLDTEWRWEYPQVIDEYLPRTLNDNFRLFEKYPHYTFNFSGANRYRFMKEYYPKEFDQLKKYVDAGRWFPAGSSMEEGDVNAPSAEAIIRQILYGNEWFRHEFGKTSAEYMLPDCFGFPSSLPTILAHSGVKGFSTQKLSWGSSAYAGGAESIEKTPAGTPFNVGVWVGPDGESVLAGFNPGSYSGGISTDLSQPLGTEPPSPALADLQKRIGELQTELQDVQHRGGHASEKDLQEYSALRGEQAALQLSLEQRARLRFQSDWAGRVLANGKATGLFADYHYVGTGDIGGAPGEESIKRLEQIITKGRVDPAGQDGTARFDQQHAEAAPVQVGQGPVRVVSSKADQMFLDITPAETARLPRYTGELELTNHSAGSLTSQAYQKRWIRKEELLADAAEKASVAAQWLSGRPWPKQQLNDAWTLTMGAHFHDLAAGTATPRSYEFAWNDDVIAMNQFAGVLSSASETVSAALNTEAKGQAVVVYNPLNTSREDVVEAQIDFAAGVPNSVHVTGPDGREVPAQISHGKVLFLASVPSVGFAVYDVQAGANPSRPVSRLHVTDAGLENEFYRVTLNADGDVASVFDKLAGRELLSAPARLAISYDNPVQWPAWNMDWEQEQAAPKAYVSGLAQIKIVEDGPARVGLQITRETAGSRFVQTIRLSAGTAGKRVEFANVIDWNTRESNLKAEFPLVASNEKATYNWDIGTIERTTAEPKKFEVPSHQWVDLTDTSGKFGATILTDCKNGSDKPNDHTIRVTLIRTPGTAGGYQDEATQDIGHHEFIYGITGHEGGWREGETDLQAERLNASLISFATPSHFGALGRSFSLLKVSSPRVRVLALKKAEESDELILRLVELDGKPQSHVRISFAGSIAEAREVNGQEQPVGPATLTSGALVTSFGAYQPRTFALRLSKASVPARAGHSMPVTLAYDVATSTNDGDHSAGGFDGKDNALPAEMLPEHIAFRDAEFQLAAGRGGTANAVTARGQSIDLPSGHYNRVYVLTASIDGDQRATFVAGGHKADLNIQQWSGFIGQWDDRIWSSKNTANDNYGEMIGLRPGFIKRADVAWYSDHHHDAAGTNVPYAYSYLFGYALDLPAGAKTLTLPDNPKIRVLAISVVEGDPTAKPVEPLYDVLPSPNAGAPDFSLSPSSSRISIPQGRSASIHVTPIPRGNFDGDLRYAVIGLPEGVKGEFTPVVGSGSRVLMLTTPHSAAAATRTAIITATSGSISHSINLNIEITSVANGTVPVDLSEAYNVTGIYPEGRKFAPSASLDGEGYAFSTQLLGAEQIGDGVVFSIGPAGEPDMVTEKTVRLPAGKFTSAKILAAAVNGDQVGQMFTVNYVDGTSASFTRDMGDWARTATFDGEAPSVEMPYRIGADGDLDSQMFYARAYTLPLDNSKVVSTISLPSNRNVVTLAITLVPVGR